MKRAKRTSPPFNTLKAATALEKSDLSAKQARGVVNVIEDAQENLVTADELEASERRNEKYVKYCFIAGAKMIAFAATGLLGLMAFCYYAYNILFG